MLDSVFQSVADVLGLPLDQARYVLIMLLNVPVAIGYRLFLHPSRTSLTVRHLVSILLGLSITIICFNWDVLFLIAIVLSSYAILHISPPNIVQRYTMIWVMSIMSTCHLYRVFTDYGGYRLDFSGPMMILVQKLSLVAFAIHDGMGGNPRQLNKDQEQQKLTTIPSLLQYVSYTFNFHSVLIGPGYTMREHLSFIDGSNLTPLENPNQFARAIEHSKEPSPFWPVVQKYFLSLVAMAGYFLIGDFSHETLLDPSYSILYRPLLILLVAMKIKLGFYFIWILSDCINNAAGLGFSGYDLQGNAIWDLTNNINLIDFETAMNPRTAATAWNVTTSRWLRRVCYDRISWQRAHMTFLLSAFWHGFYPSYYLGLVYLSFVVEASKKMWRLFNPFFTSNGRLLRWSYHLMTWLFTQVYINYGSTALQMMWPSAVYTYWKSLYFIPLVTSVIVAVFFPSGKKATPLGSKVKDQANGKDMEKKKSD